MAKNITLAIDEDLLDKARVLAAMHRTTVNAMVREFLEQKVGEESKDGLRADWDALFEKVDREATDRRKLMKGGLPPREALYDEMMRGRSVL
ncbi:MAG: DUF6364 family protein [Pseudomonadota bacterium]